MRGIKNWANSQHCIDSSEKETIYMFFFSSYFSLSNSRLKDEKWRRNQPKVLIYNRFPVSFFQFHVVIFIFSPLFQCQKFDKSLTPETFFSHFLKKKKKV